MNNWNNCQCVVCHVEEALLDSFSTQTARNHFKALSSNYPVLSHFSSPLDAVAKLHERGEAVNQQAGNQILHAVIHAISDGGALEDLGQQLLLVAFTPAIHKIYREICQRFPALPPDDVAQQAWVEFLEAAKSRAMLRQNGQLPVALVMNSRKAMLRWAIREGRRASIPQVSLEGLAEPLSEENFEGVILLDDFLWQAKRDGLLSEPERDLLFKLKYEGFEAKELGDADGMTSAHRRLHRRLQTIISRLRREAVSQGTRKAETGSKLAMNTIQKNILPHAVNFAGEVPFSNSEREFSPEPSHPVPQVDSHVAS